MLQAKEFAAMIFNTSMEKLFKKEKPTEVEAKRIKALREKFRKLLTIQQDRENKQRKAVDQCLESTLLFKKGCEAADIKPTRRQAKKYLLKKGFAYTIEIPKEKDVVLKAS